MPISDYTPTLPEVGAILRARTKDDNGNEIGTFNADTRPTNTGATSLIAQAATDVGDVVGYDLPTSNLQGAAQFVVALGAAMLIEISYWPEQVGDDRSSYVRLKEMYDERLKRLEEAVIEAGTEGTDPEPGGSNASGYPSYSFPEDGGGLVGWGTNW